MRFAVVAASTEILALAVLCAPAPAQVTIVRAPVYALDGRAIAAANRVIARTRFQRSQHSQIPHELALLTAAKSDHDVLARYETFFRNRLVAFLRGAAALGLRADDAGDARACFVQTAFKVYNGRSFGDPHAPLTGLGLWGEGAIAGRARASASLARLQFALRLKFVMGSNKRFAVLDDRGKQRVYDLYAIDSELLIEGWQAAERANAGHDRGFVRKQARQQLRADLGLDPDRVRFTPSGIEVDGSIAPKGPHGKQV